MIFLNKTNNLVLKYLSISSWPLFGNVDPVSHYFFVKLGSGLDIKTSPTFKTTVTFPSSIDVSVTKTR